MSQITAKNIGNLSLPWSLNTDLVEVHETTPIVNHGRMFITTPGNNVIALDAKTGTELWRYVKKYPFLHAFPFSNNNVFTSIDPKTGRPAIDESKRPGAAPGAGFCPRGGRGND